MTEPKMLRPPWTEEQVKNLNAYQQAGRMHPFTCGNRGDGNHEDMRGEGDWGILVATTDGWICRDCDYTQEWAHAFMFDPMWGVAADIKKEFGR